MGVAFDGRLPGQLRIQLVGVPVDDAGGGHRHVLRFRQRRERYLDIRIACYGGCSYRGLFRQSGLLAESAADSEGAYYPGGGSGGGVVAMVIPIQAIINPIIKVAK